MPENIIKIIPNGTEIKSKVALSSSSDQIIILFLGRVDIHHKGLDILVNSILRITDYLIENKVVLNIVGPYDSIKDQSYFDEMFRKHPKLNSVIKLLGPQYGDDKEKILSECDIFIHTSRYEGMPMAVLEAMSKGKPCIVTLGTNMVDIVNKADTGFAVSNDPKIMSKELKDIIKIEKDELIRKAIW